MNASLLLQTHTHTCDTMTNARLAFLLATVVRRLACHVVRNSDGNHKEKLGRGRLEPEVMFEAVNNVATTTSHLLAVALQRQDESHV